jgi:Tol biopolymer transport system component
LGETIAVYGVDGDLQAVLDGSMTCCGDYDPVWSADGTSLLVPAWTDAEGQIREGGSGAGNDRPAVVGLPLDGGKPEVVPADDPESHRSVAYSPDGTYAAYTVARPWPGALPYGSVEGPAQAQLVSVATDGTEPAAVVEFAPGEQVDGGWGWFSRPAWSPDGDRIAVVTSRYSTDPAGNPIRQQSTSLRVVDVDTGLETTVASLDGEGSLTPVAFSPDGDRILVSAHSADGTQSLSTVNVDGSGSTVLVEGADTGAWVSPPVDNLMPP